MSAKVAHHEARGGCVGRGIVGRVRGRRACVAATAMLASVSLTSGCASMTRLVAPRDDYDAYRATRAAYTVEDRLEASLGYLERFPRGRFAAEVRARFDVEEASFYARRSASIDGLDWYLRVLPAGPHAAEAAARRANLSLERSERDNDRLSLAGRATERRLARAARSRRAVVEAFTGLIAATASNEAWGRPTWAQPVALIEALRAAPDPGRCDDLRCSRVTLQKFAIPIAGGGLDERAATSELTIDLERGGVRRVTLRGPDLFSRVWEAEQGKALLADPLEARALAVGHAIDVVTGAFEGVAPRARCDRPITPPVALRRVCDGWVVVVTVGDAATDDVIAIEGPPPR